MAIQLELPFAARNEGGEETDVFSVVVSKKKHLQQQIKESQKQGTIDSAGKEILFFSFDMKLTLVCDSRKETPDEPRMYLRRISGQFNSNGGDSKLTVTEYNNTVIPPWIDSIFLGQNWVGRELLGEIYRQTAGLLYAYSVWNELKQIIDQERTRKSNILPVIIFNHPIMTTEIVPSSTESADGLIKQGDNTYKFLKSKVNEIGAILIGEYKNFFPIDRFIQDIDNKKLFHDFSFKKHFDTDYLLLNNALSPFQDTSTRDWPQIIYPPNIEESNFLKNEDETYFYAKSREDDDFYCFEVVGKSINKEILIKVASTIQGSMFKQEEN